MWTVVGHEVGGGVSCVGSVVVPGDEKSCVYRKQFGTPKEGNDSESHLASTPSSDIEHLNKRGQVTYPSELVCCKTAFQPHGATGKSYSRRNTRGVSEWLS